MIIIIFLIFNFFLSIYLFLLFIYFLNFFLNFYILFYFFNSAREVRLDLDLEGDLDT